MASLTTYGKAKRHKLLMKARKSKKPQLTSAIVVDDLKAELSKLSLRELYLLNGQCRQVVIFWMGEPSQQRLDNICSAIPGIDRLINFQIVSQRLNYLNSFPKNEFGTSAKDFFPELYSVREAALDVINKYSASKLEKAEAWLYTVAVNPSHDPDLEAAVYFASRGQSDIVDPKEIESHWYSEICYSIKSGRAIGPVTKDLHERAKNKTLSLRQAAEFMRFNGNLPGFWGFRDEEQESVDATMLRAADWYSIGGFDEWWKSAAADLSVGPQCGVEHTHTA